MHLSEILSLRSVPGVGVTMGVTRRCPLHCAHCSTNSSLSSEEAVEHVLLGFVGTFKTTSRPEIVAMSGGEAMLRPNLVRSIAEQARQVGTRSSVLSGMFFARSARIPPDIRAAIRAVHHFSASIDVYHEQEVRRSDVLRALKTVVADGTSTSVHVVGTSDDDPYVDDVIKDVRRTFGDKVPMLVNTVSSFGRARSWLEVRAPPRRSEANPCSMAAWPVVGLNGAIVACANEDVLDHVPPHLMLGHAATDDWQTIHARCLHAPMLRALRLFGPVYLEDRVSAKTSLCNGYANLAGAFRTARRSRRLLIP